MKVLVYSSFTFSYLNRARVLFSTLRRFHPDWDLVALITDEPPEGFRLRVEEEPFDRVVLGQRSGDRRAGHVDEGIARVMGELGRQVAEDRPALVH